MSLRWTLFSNIWHVCCRIVYSVPVQNKKSSLHSVNINPQFPVTIQKHSVSMEGNCLVHYELTPSCMLLWSSSDAAQLWPIGVRMSLWHLIRAARSSAGSGHTPTRITKEFDLISFGRDCCGSRLTNCWQVGQSVLSTVWPAGSG